ncbi:tRNA (uracil-5-)-methyltransferase/23S rRNA (uracil1939-C5)-methyltransferase [Peribacillus simplex]|uniref:23S rRNA (uracil(1939)-C(5))-methyltransferase RlmD n=1 Tax=Peribacillus TaxID=2675229 RepID=UPI0024E1AD2C|nr:MULTISPECIES: 23S rRNA (uracil(1939)-C(5))-methyltransferase RlmD [Peribacillus]MDF9763524.1 tRNA (uracil-5-)-methyltransferase/23S rRNA (uracil1939-C5)-methyltransferase [Peribacillus simplex]MDV7764203.1 23S rRNA (uracil(1939)-C(5))-methyltransferase RlmD [Peribacillus sp. CSMR9]
MTNIQDTKLEVDQTLPLTIKRLGINGEGVGYFKKKVVFVPGALPGEEIVALITKVQPNFSEAKIKTIRKESPHRIAAPCPVYAECGGCQLQHLSYDQQLIEKRDIVIQAMERHTKFPISSLNIKETIGMEDPWNYRNKSQYQVGQKDGKLIAGLYGLNSHNLIDIPNCLVQHKATNKVTRTVKKILKNLNISIYNERKRKGVIRTVITRVGFETGEVQVVLVTGAEEIPQKDQLLKQIRDQLPEVKSVVQNINNQNTSLIFGEKTIHLAGEKVINETLGDLSYELSARTFFQLNPVQTVRMYDEVKKAAALTGTEKVVDAYCGVGTIGLWLSEDAKEVRGMDVIKESIEDAKKNAIRHKRTNMHYETGKAENILPRWTKEGWKPDVLVVDPPRSGCDQSLLQAILKVKPKTIVYVSCNPSTLAKDLQELSALYEVESMQPVDMFPQTSHVECVSQLILKEGN